MGMKCPSGCGTQHNEPHPRGADEDIFPAANMTGTLKLMAVLAHPDDESLGTGGSLAKYGSEGVKTFTS